MRVSELAGLLRDQVNLKREEFTVRGKGDKTRVVFLSNQSRYALKQYLDLREDDAPFLFVRHDRAASAVSEKRTERTKKSQPLTSRSIERLVHRYSVA